MPTGRLHLAAALSIALGPVVVPDLVPVAVAQGSDTDPIETAATGGSLLREGAYIVQAIGSLHQGEQPGWWVFRIARDNPGEELFEFTLLPCTLLASLEQLVESMPGKEIVFELTGEVFVYRGRNFLMPTHAPRLVAYVPPSRPDALDTPGGDTSAQDGSAEAILRDLDRSIGPVVRSPRKVAKAATARSNAAPNRMVAPGSLVLWRRGWMVREPDGAWSYVFAADATGLADPPMVLLPCRMLEDLQRHALQSGPDTPLLVSGRVFRYHGRNYLLPTMFRIPRYRTALRP